MSGINNLWVFILWVLPLLYVCFSRKSVGRVKFIWIVLVFFFSYFALIFYILSRPRNVNRD